MKKLNLALFTVLLFTLLVSNIFAQPNKLETAKRVEQSDKLVKPIEAYAEIIEAFVLKEGKPHVVFADISDYNKSETPIWKRYESEEEFEKDRETNESYTIAYLWKKDGKYVAVHFTYSSPSGDWAEYYYQTYRSDGTLAKVNRELRTFMGDVIVNRIEIYDEKGKMLKESRSFRDLNTKKAIKEADANYMKIEAGTVYKNLSDLPFMSAKMNSDVNAFIPNGWKLESKTVGDLNKDLLEDAVLQLTEVKEGNEEARRMLLILLKKKDGKFTKSAEAKKLLLCQGCGGVIGGPATIDIKKGILLVSQLSGSREATNILHRFRYESLSKKFRLIGEDRNDFDRLELTSEETSTNYLTGRQIIRISKGGENDVKTTVKRRRVPKSKIYIEDVNYGN